MHKFLTFPLIVSLFEIAHNAAHSSEANASKASDGRPASSRSGMKALAAAGRVGGTGDDVHKTTGKS
jgi:hypothetical protein